MLNPPISILIYQQLQSMRVSARWGLRFLFILMFCWFSVFLPVAAVIDFSPVIETEGSRLSTSRFALITGCGRFESRSHQIRQKIHDDTIGGVVFLSTSSKLLTILGKHFKEKFTRNQILSFHIPLYLRNLILLI
jgi:hypothetical protein